MLDGKLKSNWFTTALLFVLAVGGLFEATIAQVVIFGFAFLALMGTIDNSNLFKET